MGFLRRYPWIVGVLPKGVSFGGVGGGLLSEALEGRLIVRNLTYAVEHMVDHSQQARPTGSIFFLVPWWLISLLLFRIIHRRPLNG